MYIDGVQTPAMLLASLPLPIPVSDYLRLIPIMLWCHLELFNCIFAMFAIKEFKKL